MKMKLEKYVNKKTNISIIPSWSDPEQIFKIEKKIINLQ